MAFNGNGFFVRLYNWVNDAGAGIDISSTKMDAEENGFATGLSNCICRDGQSTVSADIPWNNNKITGVKDATNPQDAVNLRTLQSNAPVFVSSGGVAGTANAITLTGTIAAYAAGQRFSFPASGTNTSGTVTININGLGTKSIKKTIGGTIVALAVGDIPGSRIIDIEYDGTQFQIMNLRAYSQGADVASASTIVLDTATGDYVHVTGVTGITAITLAQGRQATVEFTGILTITNGASLICLSGANITTAAGDCAIFRGEASGVVRMVSYQLASGLPLVAPSSGGSYTQIATSTPGAVATVDFTSIPATYRGLLAVWSGISSDTASRQFKITPNCGAGFGSEKNGYIDYDGTSLTGQDNNVNMNIGPSLASGATTSGSLYLPNYASAGYKDYSIGSLSSTSVGSTSIGKIQATGAVQGLRFFWNSTGNFDAGTITLYGVN